MLKVLRDNLSLLGLLIVLVGVSGTEAYYGTFGLRYQFLSLPAQHILYRGLASIFESWVICLCYFIGLVAIAGQSRFALAIGGLDRLRLANYLLVVLLSVTAWFSAGHAGVTAAIKDSTVNRSGLPVITKLVAKPGTAIENINNASEGYRLLLHASAGAYLLRPVRDPANEQPIVRFVSGGSIESISLCTRC